MAGNLATSVDGITWIRRISGLTVDINDMCYGHGVYIAVANSGKMITSTNGITWSALTSSFPSNAYIYGIIFENSRYIAVGWSGQVATRAVDTFIKLPKYKTPAYIKYK